MTKCLPMKIIAERQTSHFYIGRGTKTWQKTGFDCVNVLIHSWGMLSKHLECIGETVPNKWSIILLEVLGKRIRWGGYNSTPEIHCRKQLIHSKASISRTQVLALTSNRTLGSAGLALSVLSFLCGCWGLKRRSSQVYSKHSYCAISPAKMIFMHKQYVYTQGQCELTITLKDD